jgi:hypothetical protein
MGKKKIKYVSVHLSKLYLLQRQTQETNDVKINGGKLCSISFFIANIVVKTT